MVFRIKTTNKNFGKLRNNASLLVNRICIIYFLINYQSYHFIIYVLHIISAILLLYYFYYIFKHQLVFWLINCFSGLDLSIFSSKPFSSMCNLVKMTNHYFVYIINAEI